jgi:3-oxoacid CoA-transferase
VETGGIPIKYKSGKLPLEVDILGNSKEVRMFDDRRHIFEPAISGDIALLRAWKVDKAGNCVFRYTTRSFGGLCARAARTTIVEADEIVEVGELNPMDVDLPGIYVDRITRSTEPKRIEFEILRSSSPKTASNSDKSGVQRQRIAKRAAEELKDGSYCNLGIGMPTLAANFIPEGIKVWLQSENGILGMGPSPTEAEVDA